MADNHKKLTQILKIKGDWEEVVNDCRATVGKGPLGKEPSAEFKRKILMAEHSPIRDLIVKWIWPNMPHWVTVHWVRHKWECYVRTQREDRTGIPRDKLPQDKPQDFTGEANPQHTIDSWRKRLCFQASSKTRRYAEDFKVVLHEIEPEWSDVLVPNCVYRGGCPEMINCPLAKNNMLGESYWELLMSATNGEILTSDLQKRYDLYNKFFWKTRRGEHDQD